MHGLKVKKGGLPRALFTWQNFGISGTVAISFVFDKYYPNMD
jgi:hypothetical protein